MRRLDCRHRIGLCWLSRVICASHDDDPAKFFICRIRACCVSQAVSVWLPELPIWLQLAQQACKHWHRAQLQKLNSMGPVARYPATGQPECNKPSVCVRQPTASACAGESRIWQFQAGAASVRASDTATYIECLMMLPWVPSRLSGACTINLWQAAKDEIGVRACSWRALGDGRAIPGEMAATALCLTLLARRADGENLDLRFDQQSIRPACCFPNAEDPSHSYNAPLARRSPLAS